MDIRLSIKKRHVYVLSFVILVFASMLLVKGYGTQNPSVFGHTAEEIDIDITGPGMENLGDWLRNDICRKDGTNCPSNAPNYDSGWLSDNNNANHKTTVTHNLNSIPSRIEVWFATSSTPTTVYPLTWSWEQDHSGNPVTVDMTSTTATLHIFNNAPLHGTWNASTGTWTYYKSGYWRVLLWR